MTKPEGPDADDMGFQPLTAEQEADRDVSPPPGPTFGVDGSGPSAPRIATGPLNQHFGAETLPLGDVLRNLGEQSLALKRTILAPIFTDDDLVTTRSLCSDMLSYLYVLRIGCVAGAPIGTKGYCTGKCPICVHARPYQKEAIDVMGAVLKKLFVFGHLSGVAYHDGYANMYNELFGSTMRLPFLHSDYRRSIDVKNVLVRVKGGTSTTPTRARMSITGMSGNYPHETPKDRFGFDKGIWWLDEELVNLEPGAYIHLCGFVHAKMDNNKILEKIEA